MLYVLVGFTVLALFVSAVTLIYCGCVLTGIDFTGDEIEWQI